MPTLIETNIGRSYLSAQTAKGTPATTPSRSMRQVGGNFVVNPTTGGENYVTGDEWGATTRWLDNLLGNGGPIFQCSADDLAWWYWLLHGIETVAIPGTNAVQTLTMTGAPTGGSVTLTYDNQTTAALTSTSTAAQVQAAFEALPNVGTGNVTGAGGPWPGTAITLTFVNALQKRPVPPITLATNALTGGTTPTVTITQTTPGVLASHVTKSSANTGGLWATYWQTVGAATQQKLKHNDFRLNQLVVEASTGTKALHATANAFALDPGEQYVTDPTTALSTGPVLFFTEGSSTFTIDGRVFPSSSQFQIDLNRNMTPAYGDSPTPFDIARGQASATVTTTVSADSDFLAAWNTWIYGTPTPGAGAKPNKRVPPSGSYSFTLSKKDSAGNTIGSFNALFPAVDWQVPDSPALAPDAGTQTISLAGTLTRSPLAPTADLYTFTIGCQSAAFTA
jgi:hypothetical protein